MVRRVNQRTNTDEEQSLRGRPGSRFPRTRPELRATEGSERQVHKYPRRAPDSPGPPDHRMPPGYKKSQETDRPARFRPTLASNIISTNVGWGSMPLAIHPAKLAPQSGPWLMDPFWPSPSSL